MCGAHLPENFLARLEASVKAYPVIGVEATPPQFQVIEERMRQQGIVFEKDLGPDTEKLVAAMTEYDPDDSWDAVEETDIEEPEVTSTTP